VGLRRRAREVLARLVGASSASSWGGGSGRPRNAPAPAATGGTGGDAPPPPRDGFVAVLRAGSLPDGRGAVVAHGGAAVALFRVAGAVHAVDNACTHEDGPVGEGVLVGTCVRCPYHDWEFDVTTGACLTDPARPLATWASREADGWVWLGPRLRDGSALRGGDHNDGMETLTR
jgi:nitrite reductase/ring-hydroxylating ferredoxin subunit